MKTYTHSELVLKAQAWLRNQNGYKYVFAEWKGHNEQPDVYGFGFYTAMIECKATRSDFLVDKKKPFRVEGRGCGKYRLYCSNTGIIKPDELPDGWGLLEPSGNGLKLIIPATKEHESFVGDHGIQSHMLDRLLYVGLEEYLHMNGDEAKQAYSNLKSLYYGGKYATTADSEIENLKQQLKRKDKYIKNLESNCAILDNIIQEITSASKEEVERLDNLLKAHGICGATGLLFDKQVQS